MEVAEQPCPEDGIPKVLKGVRVQHNPALPGAPRRRTAAHHEAARGHAAAAAVEVERVVGAEALHQVG